MPDLPRPVYDIEEPGLYTDDSESRDSSRRSQSGDSVLDEIRAGGADDGDRFDDSDSSGSGRGDAFRSDDTDDDYDSDDDFVTDRSETFASGAASDGSGENDDASSALSGVSKEIVSLKFDDPRSLESTVREPAQLVVEADFLPPHSSKVDDKIPALSSLSAGDNVSHEDDSDDLFGAESSISLTSISKTSRSAFSAD